MDLSLDYTGTLRADEKGHQPLVYENHGIDARYSGPHKVAPTMVHAPAYKEKLFGKAGGR